MKLTVPHTMRQRAQAPQPEARVVETATGPLLAYVGTETALQVLEGCPGAAYVPATRLRLAEPVPAVTAWLTLPATRASVLLIETAGKLLVASPAYAARRRELMQVDMSAAHLYPPTPPGLPEPFPHQVECFSAAVASLAAGSQGFGNFLEMGLGKSRWAADFMRALRPRVTLVLIPKIIRHQWECCIEHAYPEAKLLPLFGTLVERTAQIKDLVRRLKAGEVDSSVVILLNWDVVYRLVSHLAKLEGYLDLIVADEASRLRNRNSETSKASRLLANKCPRHVPMTGTPGHPKTLWSIFNFLDPRIFDMSFDDYMHYYCVLGNEGSTDFIALRPERVPELVERIHRHSYRETKATVGGMPPKTYTVVELPLTGDQKRHYERVEKDYYTSVDLGDGVVGELTITAAIARTTRFQQICAGIVPLTSLTIGEGEAQEVHGGGYREINSVKTDWVVEWIKEHHETTDIHGIVWTKFQPEVDRLVREIRATGIEVEAIDGRTKDTDHSPHRRQILQRYGDAGSGLRWLVINGQAGAYGLDVPICDAMLMHSSTFDHEMRRQLEDRGLRLGRGKDRPYQIFDLLIRGTVDRDIHTAYLKDTDLIAGLISKGTKRNE